MIKIYLSKLVLNPRSRQVQSELRDPYQMHRTLSKAFGDEPGTWQEARVLFRVEESSGCASVLVQSKTLPEWSAMTVPDDYLAGNPETKELHPRLCPGQAMRFRLKANPTKKIADDKRPRPDGSPRPARVELFAEDKQMAWLHRKAEVGGFRVVESWVAASKKYYSSKRGAGGSIAHLGVTFEGVLEVVEPESFRAALESGIGSAKGFGFGLLSVALVR
jgi:CRISPR system Cascade subunit CasE